ncbi:MAG: GNAT family N-acetyltransferase [Actinomycetota bacterium]|nr:GNAT family N-acetyltransferase [Actinomycetota bacterium]
MELTEFSADDETAVAGWVAVVNASQETDSPWEPPKTAYRMGMEMRYGWDGELGRYFLARDGCTAVGVLEVHTSDYDNLDMAWLELMVHPAHRRRGHGTAVFAVASETCAGIGRNLLGMDGWDNPATTGFAAAAGAELKSRTIQRRMMIRQVPAAQLARMYDETVARAADYELVRIAGRTPPELLEALAEATGAINDAPLDDLEMEDERYDAARVAAYESAQIDGDHRFYRVLARHRVSGEIGGHTVVSVDADQPAVADQHDTSVVATHRGHRLGLLLKTDMVRWLVEAEPEVTAIDTWNAESNDHMIAVNEALGYRVIGRALLFQRRLGAPAPG